VHCAWPSMCLQALRCWPFFAVCSRTVRRIPDCGMRVTATEILAGLRSELSALAGMLLRAVPGVQGRLRDELDKVRSSCIFA
jgi:hypothetical protein